MMLVHSYPLAIALCVLTMICWGSWANTLKLKRPSYPFSLFYWDTNIGYVLLPLIVGLTFGSMGSTGRGLIEDLRQGSMGTYGWALAGGVVWNLANILFMSAVDIAGIAIAQPIAIGTALVEGVLINYFFDPRGNPALIFGGVALVALAIIINSLVYRNIQKDKSAEQGVVAKGITLALAGGVLMGLFYYLTLRSVSPDFVSLTPGRFGPYAAVLVNTVGALLSSFVFNSYMMRRPVKGPTATYSEFFSRGIPWHLVGILGGVINGIGFTANIVASKVASPAIAYGLGQGGTMIAAIWGIFIWKETRGASRGTQWMTAAMFVCFLSGLLLLVFSMTH